MPDDSFLLGVVTGSTEENRRRRGWILIYTPGGNRWAKAPLIGLYQGTSGHDEGADFEAATWLGMRPIGSVVVEGKIVATEATPGWFERLCHEASCEWFVPILRRLAGGEDVSLREIQATYAQYNAGREMPQGNLGDLFKIVRKKGLGPSEGTVS